MTLDMSPMLKTSSDLDELLDEVHEDLDGRGGSPVCDFCLYRSNDNKRTPKQLLLAAIQRLLKINRANSTELKAHEMIQLIKDRAANEIERRKRHKAFEIREEERQKKKTMMSKHTEFGVLGEQMDKIKQLLRRQIYHFRGARKGSLVTPLQKTSTLPTR